MQSARMPATTSSLPNFARCVDLIQLKDTYTARRQKNHNYNKFFNSSYHGHKISGSILNLC